MILGGHTHCPVTASHTLFSLAQPHSDEIKPSLLNTLSYSTNQSNSNNRLTFLNFISVKKKKFLLVITGLPLTTEVRRECKTTSYCMFLPTG